jgi:hypothetical protein
MDRGARVKFKPGSKAQAHWRIRDDVAGLVLARYRAPQPGRAELVDVSFGVGMTVWGERASEFVILIPDKMHPA